MIADALCPECHGDVDLVAVKSDRLVKKCVACGHRWNEERSKPAVEFVDRGGWVRLNGEGP